MVQWGGTRTIEDLFVPLVKARWRSLACDDSPSLFGLQVSEAMGLQETTSLLDRKGGETYGPDNTNGV